MSWVRGMIGAALMVALPAVAGASVPDTNSEMRQYVRARLADAGGQPDAAAVTYARLLQESPGDKQLALRAYRQALTAGNYKLAILAAQQLDKAKALPPDAVLMLLSEAVAARNWERATQVINRIEREQLFGFLVPVMRAWVAFGRGAKDAARLAEPIPGSQLANVYARDHHLLISLATGDRKALNDLRQRIAIGDTRALRLQLAAGAILAKQGDLADARTILEGRRPELAAARAALDAGRIPAGAVDTPAAGLAELFAQLAVDVKSESHAPISLLLARIACYLAPDSAAATITAADLLASNGYSDTALALLAKIPADNPLWEAGRQERGSILLAAGNREGALADAKRVAEQPGANAAAFVDLGGILSELDRPAEAARAYQRAIDLDATHGQANWAYYFLKAGALDRAGDWAGAKNMLRQANKLDPGQAVVLNYLGYGMLDRGENPADAQTYIERASALDPTDAAIADSLGWLYYKRGNYAGAIAALERAVAGDPGQSVMNEHLGDAYWATGRRIEARYAWRAALVQADKPSADRIKAKLADGLNDATAAK
jgi:Flp pilus assembly protein TadD